MTKEEILNGMSEEEFYNLYPTEEAYFMAKGGSLSGAPHNGQPTADEFFSYGAPALGHMNIPMSNPTYLAKGGTYFGGPIRPYAYGGDLQKYQGKEGGNQVPYIEKFKIPNSNDYMGDLYFENNDEKIQVPFRHAVDVNHKKIALKLNNLYSGAVGRGPDYNPDAAKGAFDVAKQMYNEMKTKPTFDYNKYQNKVDSLYNVYPPYESLKYGGYMDMGGYNSPTNYGSFSVPMAYGGFEEYGGILDASNNQDFPMMEEGGRANLMKIIKAASKKMKKEYADGGNTTMQGGNQDYLTNMKGTYDNFLKQNVYNSLVDQEQQDLSKAFMEKGGQPSFFQMLAERYAPTEKVSGLNYFPANINRGYELSNQDYSKLSQLGSDAKLSGLGVTYGPLARGLGKFGRKMFGPKEIYFDIMHNKPTIQTKPYQQASATTTAPTETDRRVIRDPNREMNLGPAIQPKANPNFNWGTTFGYGGNYQTGGNPSAMSNNWSFAGASAPQFTTPQSVGIQAPAPITMQDSGAPLVSGDTMLNKDTSRVGLKRDYSGLASAIGQYAVPGINTLAGMIEAPGQQRRQKQAMLNAMTPGSDTGPFAVKPTNAMNRGDYDPNTGMFRPNAMVPVQFPGGSYGAYGGSFQDGGMFEEGEELDLSPEEIEELRNQGYEIEELD